MTTIKRTTAFLAFLACLAVAACGGERDESGPASRGRESLFPPCDVREVACQQAAVEEAARLRESPGSVPVITVRSVEDVIADANEGATEEDRADYAITNQALALLGLSRADSTLDDVTSDQYENVAAFYSLRTKEVTIVDHGEGLDPADSTLVLIHELIHAMQDADGAFAKADADATNTETILAHRSVLEGEAVLYQLLASVAMQGYRPSQVDWDGYFDEFQERMLADAIADEFPVYSASQQFVYAFGGEYAYSRWLNGDATAVKALYDAFPHTTYEVVFDELPPNRSGFSIVSQPQLADGYTAYANDDLSWWVFKVWCMREATLTDVCESGVANSATVVVGPGSSVSAVWRVRFKEEGAAATLADVPGRTLVDNDLVVFASTAEGVTLSDVVTGWGPAP